MQILVIGGGAAGFFAACAAAKAGASVSLFEKTSKTLAKVRISGGGRCNVTHACFNPRQLEACYPRGGRQLRHAFATFHVQHTVEWFAKRGVRLKTEPDGRMFPVTDSSETIARCLENELSSSGAVLRTQTDVRSLKPLPQGGFAIQTAKGEQFRFDKVIVATGGSPKREGLNWLEALGHAIADPVPSLFTFNMPKNPVCALMGVSVPEAKVRIVGEKLEATGPVLITHWGMSGPAVLRLSALGARILHQKQYRFEAMVNWLPSYKEPQLRETLFAQKRESGKRQVGNRNPFGLPSRLWLFLLEKTDIGPGTPWGELKDKSLNRLSNTLMCDSYPVSGKTTFKEEFVTCGGVALSEVNWETMESKHLSGLYFTGEVLDVDGITGGFNFQAAWSTGYLAGQHAARTLAHSS